VNKKSTIVFLTAVLIFSFLFSQFINEAFALESYSTQKELRISSAGTRSLHIRTPRNLGGALTLQTWEEPDVLAKYEKQIKAPDAQLAEKLAEMIEVEIEKHGYEVELNIKTPFRAPWQEEGYQVDLNLQLFVPEEYSFESKTSNFNLDIDGSLKQVDISSSNGTINVKQVKENTQIASSNGKIYIEDLSGEVNIETSNYPIRAVGIDSKGKSAYLRNNNEEVRVEWFKGALEVETSNAPIVARGLSLIDGDSRFENSNSDIELEIEELSSSIIEIDNSYGNVSISLPQNSSFELSFSVGSGGKIHTRNLLIQPKLIEKTMLKGVCGEGESSIEVFVNGIGEIELLGIEK
jgi:hypothetical protein